MNLTNFTNHPNLKNFLIIGAGPAGLTAAYKLTEKGIQPKIVERDKVVGGISRTVKYKNYRFDIGGHRFFTKSKIVNNLWQTVLKNDFLIRPRLSRWYFNKTFFNYPIQPFEIIQKFGFKSLGYISSLIRYKIFPIKPELSASDWYTNQFGKKLAEPFFIKYNEKLWGMPCDKLSMDFGKQRVKGVSLFTIIFENFKKLLHINSKKNVTSFIEEFNYPKFGPGMMWEKFAETVTMNGGEILLEHEVIDIKHSDGKVDQVTIRDRQGNKFSENADYYLTSLPLKELILRLNPVAPDEVVEAAERLKFRDFVTVALILDKAEVFPDTWIYTHDANIRCIRMQNFNNWSPFMVASEKQTCIGLEYVCNFNDNFWNLSDSELKQIAINDLNATGFAQESDVIDFSVVRMKEVYPVYDLEYKRNVEIIKKYIAENLQNVYPIGRGGMHKYNNQDHSMLTAIVTVENILNNEVKINPWEVNTEEDYHEEVST